MIGNDIIDIEYTRRHTDWKRRGWIDKVFDEKEQESITIPSDSFLTVWRMWSMKEAVYKLHMRSTQERSFNPLSLSCRMLDDEMGVVEVDRVKYFTQTNFTNDYIFTSTVDSRKMKVDHHIKSIDAFNFESRYDIILDTMCNYQEWDKSKCRLVKNDLGIPEIYFNDKKSIVMISITHHGKYLGFSYCC